RSTMAISPQSWRTTPVACAILAVGAHAAMTAPHFCGIQGVHVASVIASGVRKGNIIDIDGKLYVVLTAENFHPGKGTPTTQIEMRRISDGVKINERYKTTDSLEKAFVDMRTNNFLYQDGEAFVFMDPENFDQVHVSAAILGD